MKFPATVNVQLMESEGEPLTEESVLMFIELYEEGHQRYIFLVGATDPTGRVRVDPQSLSTQLEFNKSQNPEEYGTSLEDCDDVFSIALWPAESIEGMVDVLKEAPSTPENAAALKLYRDATNFKFNPARTVFNLSEVPPAESVVLRLGIDPAGTEPPESENAPS